MHAVGSEGAVRGVQDQRPVWLRAGRRSGIERTTLGDWLSGERGLSPLCLVGREASKETAWLLAWATGCWELGMGPRMQKKSPKRLTELGGGSWKSG